MLSSRDIDRLRPDVAANCRVFLARCKAEGLSPLITGTVRDAAFQEDCYRRGTARTPVPSFHSEQAGLAFDFCKNKKGEEYDDPSFFEQCGRIGKEIGFTWGGDWTSFPDRPHLQWDEGGRYTASMVIAGKYPPPMPLWGEETGEAAPSAWAAESAAWAREEGLIRGDEKGNFHWGDPLTREELAVILKRFFDKWKKEE